MARCRGPPDRTNPSPTIPHARFPRLRLRIVAGGRSALCRTRVHKYVFACSMSAPPSTTVNEGSIDAPLCLLSMYVGGLMGCAGVGPGQKPKWDSCCSGPDCGKRFDRIKSRYHWLPSGEEWLCHHCWEPDHRTAPKNRPAASSTAFAAPAAAADASAAIAEVPAQTGEITHAPIAPAASLGPRKSSRITAAAAAASSVAASASDVATSAAADRPRRSSRSHSDVVHFAPQARAADVRV